MSRGVTLTHAGSPFRDARQMSAFGWPLAFVLAACAALLVPHSTMGIDDTLHVSMVRALLEQGHLHIAENGGVAGSPALKLLLTHDVNGLVMPQYPSGYALLAAPFYFLFGIKGLVMMNALALVAILFATQRLAMHLFADERLAWASVAFLGAASFLPGYGFVILPHLSSLALIMIAAERAVYATLAEGEPRLHFWLGLAGLALGIAINLRVDVILAIVCLFFWTRLIAFPGRLTPSLAFLAGLVPGLLLASMLNYLKFGSFIPISYGPKTGDDGILNYLLPLAAIGCILIASLFANTNGLRFSRLWSLLLKPWVIPSLLAGTVAAALLLPAGRTYAHSLWVLVVDLQQASDWQTGRGMVRDGWGFASFYGLDKKALLQSLPWLVLLCVPIMHLAQGRQTRALTLCLAGVAAPLAFYALRQWHGGFAANMRYFLPALPFAAVLAAYAACHLWDRIPGLRLAPRSALLAGLVGACLSIAAASLGTGSPVCKIAIFYLPLLVAGLALACLALLLLSKRPATTRIAPLAACLVAAGIGQGAIAGVQDGLKYQQITRSKGAYADITATAFPEGALVVAAPEELFMDVRRSGAFHTTPGFNQPEDLARLTETVTRFRAEGRCVYLFSSETVDGLSAVGPWAETGLQIAPGFRSIFHVPQADLESCSLQADPH